MTVGAQNVGTKADRSQPAHGARRGAQILQPLRGFRLTLRATGNGRTDDNGVPRLSASAENQQLRHRGVRLRGISAKIRAARGLANP